MHLRASSGNVKPDCRSSAIAKMRFASFDQHSAPSKHALPDASVCSLESDQPTCTGRASLRRPRKKHGAHDIAELAGPRAQYRVFVARLEDAALLRRLHARATAGFRLSVTMGYDCSPSRYVFVSVRVEATMWAPALRSACWFSSDNDGGAQRPTMILTPGRALCSRLM
jgi:hypothetical protein